MCVAGLLKFMDIVIDDPGFDRPFIRERVNQGSVYRDIVFQALVHGFQLPPIDARCYHLLFLHELLFAVRESPLLPGCRLFRRHNKGLSQRFQLIYDSLTYVVLFFRRIVTFDFFVDLRTAGLTGFDFPSVVLQEFFVLFQRLHNFDPCAGFVGRTDKLFGDNAGV